MKLIFLSLLLSVLTLRAQPFQEKILAAVLAAEASSEGVRGMSAVAEVINQRAKDKSRTPFQVVTSGTFKHRAFSCLNGVTVDTLYKRWSQDPNFGKALKVAAVLVHQPELLGNQTKRATHYTLKRERPYWAKGKQPVVIIGQHAFYRLDSY